MFIHFASTSFFRGRSLFGKMVLAIFSLLLLGGTALADLSSEYKNKASMNNDYMVYWTYNASSDMMYIAAEVKATGWVSFAFTEAKSSNMKDYDACIGSVSGGSKDLKDYLTNGHITPMLDSQQDCILDEAMENSGTTTLKYHRKVNTGDSKDVPIKKGEITVVWAYKDTQDSLSYHGRSNRGFATLTMISSGNAALLKGFYWKFAVALLSVATVFFSK